MTPYFESEHGKLYHGNVLDVLKELPEESVQMCVTSPPYWGLRDYGIEPQIWIPEDLWGCPYSCEHEWGDESITFAPDNSDHKGKITHKEGFISPFRAGLGYVDQKQFSSQGQFCLHCNAWRGSLGLEPTPELYVSHIVQIFRGVWRVLRKEGTLWLNLGDSYAGGGHGGHIDNKANKKIAGPSYNQPTGLKPKDLCMIPAKVALALQQPYYTGRIKQESDRAWLAGVIDSDGCIFISRKKVGQPTGKVTNGKKYVRTIEGFSPGLSVCGTILPILERCQRITGIGSIREDNNHGAQAYSWRVESGNAKKIIQEVYPFLVGKKQQARLAFWCPPSGDKATSFHSALIDIHKVRASSVDADEPPTMYEPGWWLRNDIILAKRNPMPESVTDRCSQSYEHMFLLAKSGKYYFDAEAIKEPHSPDGRNVTTTTVGPGAHENYQGSAGHERWPNNGRNKRDVWSVVTEPTPFAHFATFGKKWIEPCILAGTSEKGCCPECGKGWERVVEKSGGRDWHNDTMKDKGIPGQIMGEGGYKRGQSSNALNDIQESKTIGWQPGCKCYLKGLHLDKKVPCTVLDPFMGSGTTALVAYKHGRRFIGIDLSKEYLDEITIPRIENETRQLKLF